MSILRFTEVTREVGTFVILDRIDAAIALGDRVGLVGPNGAGKTTLLRLASGRDEPDRGQVVRKRGLTLRPPRAGGASRRGLHGRAGPAHRGPERGGAPRADGRRARDVRAGGPGHRRPPTRTSSTSSRSSAATRSDQRVDSALSGLGFERSEWTEAAGGMSGGEQTRASLARLRDRGPGSAPARRADQPPRPRRARVARGPPAQAGGLAARRVA